MAQRRPRKRMKSIDERIVQNLMELKGITSREAWREYEFNLDLKTL